MKYTTLTLAGTLAFAGTLVVNALANILPINNLNTGEVSNRYPSLFTPAGITFSVWTVIYILLAAFVVMAWRWRQSRLVHTILPWFIASCLINVAWILVWHHLLVGLSVVLMLALLYVLARIFLLLRGAATPNTKEAAFIHLPFVLYFAWICVATMANIAALLVSMGWNGGTVSPEVWTVTMMAVAAGLACFIAVRFRAAAFALVVMWALFGIYWRWRTSHYELLVYSAVVLILIVGAAFLLAYRRARRIV